MCVRTLRENVFTEGSKSNSSSCFLQLCVPSEIFKSDFPVLGALKAFFNPITIGEQCLTKNDLVMFG